MTAQEHIIAELEKLKQPIVLQDIGKIPLQDAIYNKVMSKKFRKIHADQPAIDTVKTAIKLSAESNKPIRLVLWFGGNKLWRFNEAPNIEWGELFSLIYYVNWAKYIASVYKPGVIVEYFSQDVCVERMNNVPHEQTDQYSADMLKLFEWAKPYIPDGVAIKYTRYGDFYNNRNEYYQELDTARKDWLQKHDGILPELDDAKKAAVELNVKLNLGQNDDPLWREKVELEHRAIFGTKAINEYSSNLSAIPHCPTWYSGFIATGSTKKSLAKFWAGIGALERSGNKYNEIILTPKQLESAKFAWEDTNINGLQGKNLSKIRILS
jgi:hypothetical protein